MIIRRNTKVYKTIVDIVSACETRSDRDKLIRLYITRAGHTIHDRLAIEGIAGDNAVFYELNYAAVLANLKGTGRQLHESDEVPGLYFFHAGNNTSWDETPFEFDPGISTTFSTLPNLPTTRKREKPTKVEALPKSKLPPAKKAAKETQPRQPAVVKTAAAPKQPRYKLKHPIQFTDLDKIVIRDSKLTKENLLDYYYKIADQLLPHLKNRPIHVRQHNDRGVAKYYVDPQALQHEARITLPPWSTTTQAKTPEVLLCDNKEDLLFYIEHGVIDLYVTPARIKSSANPDYAVMGITAAEDAWDKVIDAALIANQILTGLQLPSLVKTSGASGLDIYIPLDNKSHFESAGSLATFIARLIRLKTPNTVALTSTGDHTYGKVVIDDQLNEAGKVVIAPYSLLPTNASVATPLLWTEVTHSLRPEVFTHDTIFKRLKAHGDLFTQHFKKKVNAPVVAKALQKHYGFLV